MSAAEPSAGKLFRMQQWTPDSWRALPAAQQPDWPDTDALDRSLFCFGYVRDIVLACV